MITFLFSTIVRQETFGISSFLIPDENERVVFPSSQTLFSNVIQFEITYKSAFFTFPILENLNYSFYFDTIYGIGTAYKFENFSLGFNGFKLDSEFLFNFGAYVNYNNFESKFSLNYKNNQNFGLRSFFKLSFFEQYSSRLYLEYQNNLDAIIGIFYEPSKYRFLSFGLSKIDNNYFSFSSLEVLIFRDFLTLRGSVYEDLKNNKLFLNYGFSISYENLRGDFIVNKDAFKLGIYYKFNMF
ncbi:MAG: hypothetical protein ABIL76_02115 [candidate division WOR-3 bacterium]